MPSEAFNQTAAASEPLPAFGSPCTAPPAPRDEAAWGQPFPLSGLAIRARYAERLAEIDERYAAVERMKLPALTAKERVGLGICMVVCAFVGFALAVGSI
jgi:hypothetical protein